MKDEHFSTALGLRALNSSGTVGADVKADHPDPLIPGYVDLTSFDFMPLYC